MRTPQLRVTDFVTINSDRGRKANDRIAATHGILDQYLTELVIQTDGLTKTYGDVLAVDDLSLRIPRGSIFGLLGPNGSGKTTTMGMLLGLVKPTSGSFILFDSETKQEDSLHRVGAIVETPSFYPYLSGRSNLAYFQGITGRNDQNELDDLLSRVGLAERGHSRFRTYSLGMKQRLGLAYALLGDPELLILDEPTNGMDPAGMAEMRDLIPNLATGGRTVLLSSHLLHEVEQVCDSVAILSHGKLIAQGEVSELVHSRGEDKIRLATTDNAKAVDVLSAMDWVSEVSLDGDSVLVTAPSERSSDISATLGRSEIYVTEMAVVEMSLEQYFLDVTEDESED